MKKSKIAILAVLLFAMIALTATFIAAWLTDTKNTPPTTFTVGDVEFTWNGSTISTENPIVPGQNLIASKFYLANASTVDTELRVQVIATYTPYGETESVDGLQYLSFSLMEGWTLSGDGKWYYDQTIVPETEAVDVIDTMTLDGSKVGNTFSNGSFTVHFIFEAKQKDYVTWAQLGDAEIDFSTGI